MSEEPKKSKGGRPVDIIKSIDKDKLVILRDYDLKSDWTVTQQIAQEILATHTIQDPDARVTNKVLKEELLKEIEIRFKDDTEIKDLILSAVPHERAIAEWTRKEGWDEAVWKCVRADGLFTAPKRAQMIESLRKRGLDRSDVAAKIWLQLSGDYQEGGPAMDNSMIDTFRQINEILHNKKSS